MATWAYPEVPFGYIVFGSNTGDAMYWQFISPGGPVAIDVSSSVATGDSSDWTNVDVYHGTSWDDAVRVGSFDPYFRVGETFYLPKSLLEDTVAGDTYVVEVYAGTGVSEVALAVTGVRYGDWFQPPDFTAISSVKSPIAGAGDPTLYGHLYESSHETIRDGVFASDSDLITYANDEWGMRDAYDATDQAVNLQVRLDYSASRSSGFLRPTTTRSQAYAKGTSFAVKAVRDIFWSLTLSDWDDPDMVGLGHTGDLTMIGVDYAAAVDEYGEAAATWLGLNLRFGVWTDKSLGIGTVHARFNVNASPVDQPSAGRTIASVHSDDFGTTDSTDQTVLLSEPILPEDYANSQGYFWLVAQEPVVTADPTSYRVTGSTGANMSIWATMNVGWGSPSADNITYYPERQDRARPPMIRYVYPEDPVFDLLSPDLAADIDRIQANFDRL